MSSTMENSTSFLKKLFLLLVLASSSGRKIRPPFATTPKISVGSWRSLGVRGGFPTKVIISHDEDENYPVTLMGESTYLLKSEVNMIFFQCEASYPVEWTFPNSKWILQYERTMGFYTVHSRRTVNGDDLNATSTFKYVSELGLFGDSRLYNGNFICKGSGSNSNGGSRSANITIFWEQGMMDSVFPLSEKNLTIYIDDQDHLVFPCFVNNPHANVVLKRNDQELVNKKTVDNWVTLNKSKSLTWDPATGFTLTKEEDSIQMSNYKCVATPLLSMTQGANSTSPDDDFEELDVVYFNAAELVRGVQLNEPIPKGSNASLTANKTTGTYKCCSDGPTPPALMVHACSDLSICRELVAALKTQQTSKSVVGEAYFNRYWTPHLASYLTQRNGSCTTARTFSYLNEMNVVQCVGKGINVMRRYNPSNGEEVKEGEEGDLSKSIEIYAPSYMQNTSYKVDLVANKTDEFQVYDGSVVTFACRVQTIQLSLGVRFSLKVEGGGSQVLPDEFKTRLLKGLPMVYSSRSSERASVKINSTTIGLSCHVPKSNSTEWVTKSVKFSVKTAREPAILFSDDSTPANIAWTLNDTKKHIRCRVTGDPAPKVVWMTKGKEIRDQYNISRVDNNTYDLHIPKVIHEVHGEFHCIAINFKGRAEQIYTVIVEEPSASHAFLIAGSVFVILVVLALTMFLFRKFLIQNRNLQALKQDVHPPVAEEQ